MSTTDEGTRAIDAPARYFRKPGVKRTDAVLLAARARMQELGLRTLVVATTRGYTGIRAVELLRPDFEVLVVIENTGYRNDRVPRPEESSLRLIEERGGVIVRTDHSLGGVRRAVRSRWGNAGPGDIMAHTLYLFGQGMKVAVEVAVMAADVRLLSPAEPVVAAGGTSRGCDTAIIVTPATAENIFDLRIVEIICMPSPGHPGWQDTRSTAKGH